MSDCLALTADFYVVIRSVFGSRGVFFRRRTLQYQVRVYDGRRLRHSQLSNLECLGGILREIAIRGRSELI